MFKQNVKKENEVLIPLMKGVVFPFEKLYNNIGVFLTLAGVVSLFYSVVVFMAGQNYFCLFYRGELWCVDNAFLSVFSLFFGIACLAYFMNRWYLCAYQNVPVFDAIKTISWKKDLKTLAFIVAYFVLWVVIGVVFYLLKKRVPSPDWLLELFYFVLGSAVIFFAVALLTNAVVFVRFLQNKNWLVFKFGALFDNIYKILLFFVFYLLFFAVLVKEVRGVFVANHFLPLWLNGMLISFFNYLVVCVMAVFFIASLEFQEKYIFSEKETNQD